MDGRGLLRQQRRASERRDDDHRHQLDPLGDCGRRGQRGERVEAFVDDSIERSQAGEGPLVCATGPFDQELSGGTRRGGGEPYPDPHG